MKGRTALVAAILLCVVVLSGLALSAAATQFSACEGLNASWSALNLLQAQQALRIAAALMMAC
jgi:hypothetical protein